MIVLAVGLAVAVIVGVVIAWFVGSVACSRALGILVWLALTPTLAFVPFAIAVGGSAPSSPMVSHAQLEADRVMTQQMGTVVGAGMDAQMVSDGMLQRSANPAYVAALEQHVAEFDRMAGLTP